MNLPDRKQQVLFRPLCLFVVFLFAGAVHGQESDISNADGNGDGTVTVEEFATYAKGKISNHERLTEFASMVDRDGDGEISSDEFDARIEVLAELVGDAPTVQRMEMRIADEDTAAAAIAAFDELKALVAQKDWENAQQKMTPLARDQFCATLVVMSVGMAGADFPMQIPGLSDSLDDIDDVVREYGLDRLEIDTGHSFRMEFSSDGPDDVDADADLYEDIEIEKTEAEASTENAETGDKNQLNITEQKIARHLDADGKRWEIINKLWEAHAASPLSMSVLNGTVVDHEVTDEVAYLKLDLASAREEEEQGGVQIAIMSPPVVIKMSRQADGSWLYGGRDQERTQREYQKFNDSMHGGGRSDY